MRRLTELKRTLNVSIWEGRTESQHACGGCTVRDRKVVKKRVEETRWSKRWKGLEVDRCGRTARKTRHESLETKSWSGLKHWQPKYVLLNTRMSEVHTERAQHAREKTPRHVAAVMFYIYREKSFGLPGKMTSSPQLERARLVSVFSACRAIQEQGSLSRAQGKNVWVERFAPSRLSCKCQFCGEQSQAVRIQREFWTIRNSGVWYTWAFCE